MNSEFDIGDGMTMTFPSNISDEFSKLLEQENTSCFYHFIDNDDGTRDMAVGVAKSNPDKMKNPEILKAYKFTNMCPVSCISGESIPQQPLKDYDISFKTTAYKSPAIENLINNWLGYLDESKPII